MSSGLLWEGEHGVSLSSAAGTKPIAAQAQLSEVLVGHGWTVITKPSAGPTVGRSGRRPKAVRALRHCRPVKAKRSEDWIAALAGDNLYTVVQASCLDRRPAAAQFLVRLRLGTGTVHAIGRVPAGAISLAAAAGRLALTYRETPFGPVRVEVIDASNAKRLYDVIEPNRERGGDGRLETQIDSKGDVLVTDPPFRRQAYGWWGNATTRVGRLVNQTGFVASSLADGRIAYLSEHGGIEHIDLLNLKTRGIRTMATFPGSARVLGIGLGKTRLAWAQQRFGSVTRADLGPNPCVETVPVGSPELGQRTLSQTATPTVVEGAQVSPPGARQCIEP